MKKAGVAGTRRLGLARVRTAVSVFADDIANGQAAQGRAFDEAMRDLRAFLTSALAKRDRHDVPGATSARRVTDLASRLLPAAHRARYREEYRSELYDLASAGASRCRQVLFALRLLDRSWLLRAELRAAGTRRTRS